MQKNRKLQVLLSKIKGCTLCSKHLPLGVNPVLQANSRAKVLIIGQAPGTKAHETGIPWNDASGERLREWMNVSKETFYDENKIAIIPMGFCYPGKGKSGDLPPRKECAPHWHSELLKFLPNIKLILLIGTYAQQYYLGSQRKETLTKTVEAFNRYNVYFPLVHPSPRNRGWFKKNKWFEEQVVPVLKYRITEALD